MYSIQVYDYTTIIYSTDGELREFLIGAIRNSVAMNILVHVFWGNICTYSCWVYNPQVESQGHKDVDCPF